MIVKYVFVSVITGNFIFRIVKKPAPIFGITSGDTIN